jgi:hypothetical protein
MISMITTRNKTGHLSYTETESFVQKEISILLRGIQLTHVQSNWGSSVKMVFSYKICTFHDANTCVALPNGAHTFLVLSQQ